MLVKAAASIYSNKWCVSQVKSNVLIGLTINLLQEFRCFLRVVIKYLTPVY